MQPTETIVTKPSIVFAHGLWADGSCFSKLIPALQAEGYEVMASQHGLDSLATDVTAVKACLARVSSPAILVGHSYGGTLITHAGTDARVAGLVYIAALAPDADETSQSQQEKFPRTDVFDHVEVTDGRLWLKVQALQGLFDALLPVPAVACLDVIVAEGAATSRPIRLLGIDAMLALYPTLDDALREGFTVSPDDAPAMLTLAQAHVERREEFSI